jgi:hypothetical protein
MRFLLAVGAVSLTLASVSCGGDCAEPALYTCTMTRTKTACPEGSPPATWTDDLDVKGRMCGVDVTQQLIPMNGGCSDTCTYEMHWTRTPTGKASCTSCSASSCAYEAAVACVR